VNEGIGFFCVSASTHTPKSAITHLEDLTAYFYRKKKYTKKKEFD
jgi:hypothetical protein